MREEILAILLILSKKTLRSPCVSFACPNLVSIRENFVSGEAEPQTGRGNGASLRGGLPTGAWAGLAARRRSRPPLMPVFVFRAERLSHIHLGGPPSQTTLRLAGFRGRPQGIKLFAPRRRGRFPSLSLDFLKIKPPNNPWFDFFLSFRDNIANHFIKEGFIYDWTGKGAANLARTGGV
jgi:hypothetical protein